MYFSIFNRDAIKYDLQRSYFLTHPLFPRECIGKCCPMDSISQYTPLGEYQEHILVWKTLTILHLFSNCSMSHICHKCFEMCSRNICERSGVVLTHLCSRNICEGCSSLTPVLRTARSHLVFHILLLGCCPKCFPPQFDKYISNSGVPCFHPSVNMKLCFL